MKTIFCLLGILVSGPSIAQNQFKIQTLNFNAESSNPTLAQGRYQALLSFVKSQSTDVLLIEEAWQFGAYPNVGVAVAQELGYDVFYHYEDGVTGFYTTSTVILAKPSLHLRNGTSVKLPDSAWTIGNGSPIWISFGQTSELIGATIDLPSGQAATVWATHLSDSSQSNRIDQINFATGYMETYSDSHQLPWSTTPSFLGGDMNSDAGGPEAALFAGAGFIDSWTAAHPSVRGLTLVNDPTNSEYDPMVHSAGQFPSQYSSQGTARIDYLYFRNLGIAGVGIERVFTSPQGRIWMSDHYSLLAQFNWDGSSPGLPDADSNMASLGAPTIYDVNQAALDDPSIVVDFDVSSLRGFTLLNDLDQEVDFRFVSNTENIYNASSAFTSPGDVASFSFFAPGDYQYSITVPDPDSEGEDLTWGGTIHVH